MSELIALLIAHKFLAAGAIVTATLVTLLSDRVHFMPTWDSPFRPLLGTLAGVAGVVLDRVQNGMSWSAAAIGAVSTVMTVLVAEVVAIVTKGGGGGGAGDATKTVAGKNTLRPSDPAGPYSAKMVAFGRAAVACACMVAVTGCPGFVDQIPAWIQSAIIIEQNIAAIVSGLRSAADLFMATASVPDATKQSVEQAFQDVSLAEAAVTELLYAGNAATQEQLDAAYDHLKNAYSNLTKLLANVGAVKEVASGLLAAKRGDGTVMLAPLALKVHVVKK